MVYDFLEIVTKGLYLVGLYPESMKFLEAQSKSIDDIVVISGYGNYSTIHFSGSSTLVSSYTIKRLSEEFPALIRIHKSNLINPIYSLFPLTSPKKQRRLSGYGK